ncbi:MAG: tryptophan synthase subunit alpha [Candidatus Caenarcaniphilales bacterium]|nr:tryptophan synthase subunit alpha [Candidatus Caenarcaniphilales bacterium]
MNNKKKLLIPFFTAGNPELTSTTQLIELLNEYSDYIEVGLPHSDALADGPVIQAASHRALNNGMNIEVLFEQLKNHKIKHKNNLVLFSYLNPILRFGQQRVCKEWKELGGKAILVPDLPLEEAEDLKNLCERNGLSLIFLVAPTSTPERIKRITELSKEFIYLVSVTGVTGVRGKVEQNLQQIVQQIRQTNPSIPVVIGFGISSPESAQAAINQGADGVVIGSALVKLFEENKFSQAKELLKSIKNTIN